MSASPPPQDPHKKQKRKAKLDRYEARTAMEMRERRLRLLLGAAERMAFLAITTISALFAILGVLDHNPLWHPGGTFWLALISGGAAVKLHFLRARST